MNTVLLVGDFMVDRYWDVSVRGRSAEAPIPVHEVRGMFEYPGGAGNVQANLEALGVRVIAIPGMPPKDPWKSTYYEDGATTIPIKNRLMVGDQQVARWDEHDYTGVIDPQALDKALEDNPEIEAVVVSDYCKGSVWTWVKSRLLKSGLPLFVDTKADPIAWDYYGADVTFFPNMAEFGGYPTYDNCDKVVYKKGAYGLALVLNQRCMGWYPAMAHKVVSVNGAGDTVLATYVAAKLQGREDPLRVAAAAAAVVVEKPYTAVVTWEEINERLREFDTKVQSELRQTSGPNGSGGLGIGSQANSRAGWHGDSGRLESYASDPTSLGGLVRVA